MDARTARTQRALGGALVELMLTHEFEEITVQEVLDRAGVGRSTFYAHFRSKDDLLLSDTERFLGLLEAHFEGAAVGTQRVAPIAELFAHVDHFSAFAKALDRSGRQEAIYALFVGHLTRLIERRLDAIEAAGTDPAAAPPALGREVTARIFAAAAVELLRWWMDRRERFTPVELDRRFHEMVWRGAR